MCLHLSKGESGTYESEFSNSIKISVIEFVPLTNEVISTI